MVSPEFRRIRVLAIFLLWSPVLILALEVYAAAHIVWIEKHNAFIRAARGLQPTPVAEPLPPIQHTERICQVCSAQPGWDSSAGTYSLPAWGEPKAAQSKEEAERRRGVFAGLDEPHRNLFALLNDELVLVLDADAKIKDVYGNWLATAPFKAGIKVPQLQEFRERLLESGMLPLPASTAYLKLTMTPEPGVENDKEILLLKGGGDEPVYAFIPGDLETIRFTKLPPNSPWDGIPYFRYKKNLRNTYSGLGILFDTNNFGFRDQHVVVPKPPGVIRLLCIGGSTTEEGPTNDSTYPKLLERMLNEQFAGSKRIEVINCGTSGLTTSAHLARLADYLALQPDMVVLYEGVNDIHRDLVEYWRTTDSPLWRRLMSFSRFVRLQLNSALYPDDAALRQGIRGLCIENLHAIGCVARNRNIRVALCGIASPDPHLLPAGERQFFDYRARTAGLDPCLDLESYRHILGLLNEEIRALCDRDGFLYVPVAEHVVGGCGCFTDIYHMTNPGIERKAEVVFECLKEYLKFWGHHT